MQRLTEYTDYPYKLNKFTRDYNYTKQNKIKYYKTNEINFSYIQNPCNLLIKSNSKYGSTDAYHLQNLYK